MESSRWANVEPETPNGVTATSMPQPTAESNVALEPSVPPQDNNLLSETPVAHYSSTTAPLADDLFADDYEPIEEPASQPLQSQPAPPVTQHQRQRQKPTESNDGPTPKTPAKAQPGTDAPRVEAVRGDRSGTGGVKKAKLTEAELKAKWEAMKLKNASLSAAQARAEADEASFQEREAVAEIRRRHERQQRQQMMGERERNRLRKLNAQAGREWDAEKEDVAPVTERKYEAQEELGGNINARGPRSGRGRRSGEGRGGRGGDMVGQRQRESLPKEKDDLLTAMDFPALPQVAPKTVLPSIPAPKVEEATTEGERPEMGRTSSNSKLRGSSEVFIPSWAEEMDASSP